MPQDRLFEPLQLGNVTLKHRVVLAPLTRFRANKDHVPSRYARQYYEQRASVPGTLLITEGTFISSRSGGYRHVPGIWSEAQTQAWAEIVAAVHAKGSYIYCQFWVPGRVSDPEVLTEAGNYPLMSSSAVANEGSKQTPVEMTQQHIDGFKQDYVQAARNAMKAGFDGVEIHGANGYLIDQFWQDIVNQRSDKYGGSIENRARLGLEVTSAVIDAVGDSKKVAVRLSPWATGQGMRMKDPVPQFLHIIRELKGLGIAYLSLVESRVSGAAADGVYQDFTHENDVFVEEWCQDERPILLAGGYTTEKAHKMINEVHPSRNVAIAFGRYFIANPDLPFRIQRGIELSKWDRPTFYKIESPDGYIDCPFSKEWVEQAA